jgi:hypothetical protein
MSTADARLSDGTGCPKMRQLHKLILPPPEVRHHNHHRNTLLLSIQLVSSQSFKIDHQLLHSDSDLLSDMASLPSMSHATLDWKRQNPPKSPDFDWEMYRYVPSLAGAIACLVMFLVMALLHLYQFLKSRNRIVIFVVIGALCMFSCLLLILHFSMVAYHPTPILTDDNRRSRRIRRTHCFTSRQPSLAPVHHSRCIDARRSSMVCRNHLHDAWPHHKTCWW